MRWIECRTLVVWSCLAWTTAFTDFSSSVQAQYFPGGSVAHPNPFGNHGSGDFSNQAALDADTPLRHKPVVGLEMGVVALARETPESQTLVEDNVGNPIFDANQLQGSMGAGLDTTLNFFNLFSDCKAIDVQLRFFQAGDMASTQRVTSSANTTIFFNSIPATPVASNDVIYESRVRSFEANLVGRTPYRLRFLMGYRFFELDERFDINNAVTSSSNSTLGVFSIAENTMGGFQVGSEATLLTNGHSRIFGAFKYAILNNDVVGSARAVDANTTTPAQADTYDSVTSSLLDFQLGGSIGFTRSLSLYAGYQGLVLSDVILGLEQSRQGGVIGTTSNLPYYQDAQFHGFKITGMATW